LRNFSTFILLITHIYCIPSQVIQVHPRGIFWKKGYADISFQNGCNRDEPGISGVKWRKISR
jgi:hypothetical protein